MANHGHPFTSSQSGSYGQDSHDQTYVSRVKVVSAQSDTRPSSTSSIHRNGVHTAAAVGQNASLPLFSAAAVESGVPPLPIFPNWHNGIAHFPGLTRDAVATPLSNTYNMALMGNGSGTHPFSHFPSPPTPTSQSQSLNTTQYQHGQAWVQSQLGHKNVSRDRELSEGEFEDVGAYRPLKRTRSTGKTNNGAPLPQHILAVEDSGTDEFGRQRRPPQSSPYNGLERDKNSAYSPDPQTMGRQLHVAQPASMSSISNSHRSYLIELVHDRKSESPAYEPEYTKTNPATQPQHNTTSPSGILPQVNVARYGPTMSMSAGDIRTAATKAILNLIPHKVRFHDYVEEGINADVMDSLYQTLRIPHATSLTTLGHDAAIFSDGEAAVRMPRNEDAATPSAAQNKQAPIVNPTTAGGPVAGAHQVVGEERKDRIARLLAAKTNNSQAAAKAEKERLLKQKMAALQKSREDRAHKLVSNNSSIRVTQSSGLPPPSATSVPSKPVVAEQPISQPLAVPSTEPAPAVVSGAQIQPAIPGLFLSSVRPTWSLSQNDSPKAAIVSPKPVQRKRPVAADFDEPSVTTTSSSYKRPFGQSRQKSLVIDVSDDESEMDDDIPMDIESNDGIESRRGSSQQQPQQQQLIISGTESCDNVPPLSLTAPPLISTPSHTLAPTAVTKIAAAPADLKEKERAIQEMKRRILAMQQRQKAKQSSSGAQTPIRSDLPSAEPSGSTSVAQKVEASEHIGQMIEDTSRKVNEEMRKLEDAKAIESRKIEEVRHAEAERKRLRRAEIESSQLPLVDARVEKSRRRLEELRAEMEKHEVAIQRELADKQRLAEEMAKLGEEVEEQLQARTNELEALKVEEAARITSKSIGSRLPAMSDFDPNPYTISEKLKPTYNTAFLPSKQADPHSQLDTPVSSRLSMSNTAASLVDQLVSDQGHIPETLRPAASPTKPLQVMADDIMASNGPNTTTSPEVFCRGQLVDETPDQTLEAALQNASAQAEAESAAQSDVDMADTYAPDSNQLAPESTASPVTRRSTTPSSEQHPANEGLAVVVDESDSYEPREASQQAMDVDAPVESPPFSPAPPEDAIAPVTASLGDVQGVLTCGANGRTADQTSQAVTSTLSASNTLRVKHILSIRGTYESSLTSL